MVAGTKSVDIQDQTEKKYKNKIYGFSYLRAIACLAIIILHTVYSAVLLFENTISPTTKILSLVIVNCMMWAVPCFVMVTGALLLDPNKKIGYKKLFCKYIYRVFAALILFGMLFRIFDIFMDKEPVNISAFLKGFYEIFTGTSWSHIWYLYLLIGLYLLLPFYKKIVCYSSKNELIYLLGVYVIFLSILPILKIWDLDCGFYIHVSTIYPFYLFCGYAIYNNIFCPNKAGSLLLILAGTFFIVLFTIIRWKYEFPSMEILWGYSSVFVIMQAVGLFSLMKNMKESILAPLKYILTKIDEYSFGIYLVHMIFVRLILRYMQFNPYKNGGIIAFLGVLLIVFSLSYIIVWILKKLPFINKVI